MTMNSLLNAEDPRWGRPPRRMFAKPYTLIVPVVVLLILPGLIGYFMLRPPQPFTPSFDGPDRLVTNERAYHHPDMPGVVKSDDWAVTSGSLFAHHGYGWTGEPDNRLPNPESSNGTGSAVFRAVSTRTDFRNVQVSLRLRIEDLISPPGEEAYDGVHLFLRYQDASELYGVTVFRRDGTVVVKRKLPGEQPPGDYLTLATADRETPLNEWIDVVARIVTLDSGSVRITLSIDGERALTATDNGRKGHTITHTGRVGLRGDNCQFSFTDFRAENIG